MVSKKVNTYSITANGQTTYHTLFSGIEGECMSCIWSRERCFSPIQFVLAMLILFPTTGCDNDKYPTGRDTVQSFGNGRFQIGRTPSMKFLIDMATKENIMLDISDWQSQGDRVYLVNANGLYTVLNYRTGYYRNYPNLDSVDPEYIDFCKSLSHKE